MKSGETRELHRAYQVNLGRNLAPRLAGLSSAPKVLGSSGATHGSSSLPSRTNSNPAHLTAEATGPTLAGPAFAPFLPPRSLYAVGAGAAGVVDVEAFTAASTFESAARVSSSRTM